MTDKTKRLLLFVVLALIICALAVGGYYCHRQTGQTDSAKVETAKQNAQQLTAALDATVEKHSELVKQNKQKESEAGQNAYEKACEDCSNDADALIAWSELVTRARNANRQRGNNGD